VVQGVVQGVDRMSARVGIGWALLPIAVLIAIAMAGATSAWISGSARILFVSGIDRYLPRMFARVHPKYGTPHIALIGFAALSSLLIAMSFIGKASVKEAYVTLLDLAVVLQMISLELGEITEFPFVEPPDVRSVNDGIALLQELGALDGRSELTPVGRQLAALRRQGDVDQSLPLSSHPLSGPEPGCALGDNDVVRRDAVKDPAGIEHGVGR